ncbi:MAG TPA: CHAD domain-containing protein [Chloroflexota bacterium]
MLEPDSPREGAHPLGEAAAPPRTTGELALQVLRMHAAAFAEHAPQARLGGDPEHVHQTRVATRRLRAGLRVFADVLPPDVGGLREELGWIAAQLGPVRDLDVQVGRLGEIAAQLDLSGVLAPYGTWLEDQRQRALAVFDDAFRSERFTGLTDRLGHLDELSPPAGADQPLLDDASRRLRRAFRRLRKRANGLGNSAPASRFHQARIGAKRLRYTTEFFEPVYGKPARRLIKTATSLQDLLGDHQDGIVSGQRIHEAVQTAAGAWPAETSLALGRIVQWEAEHGRDVRRRFRPSYREVEDAWKRLRRAL